MPGPTFWQSVLEQYEQNNANKTNTTTNPKTPTTPTTPSNPVFMGTVDDQINASVANQNKPAITPTPTPAPVTPVTPTTPRQDVASGPVFTGTVDDQLNISATVPAVTPTMPDTSRQNAASGPIFTGTVDDQLAIDASKTPTKATTTNDSPIFMGTVDDKLAVDAATQPDPITPTTTQNNLGASILASILGALAGATSGGTQTSPTVKPPVITPSTTPTTAPTIEVPKVEVPTINMPTLELPTIETPTYNLPTLNMPTLEQPEINLPTFTSPGYTAPNVPMSDPYTAATLPTYQAQTDKINELYDMAKEIQLAQLQSAYDKNVLNIENALKQLPGVYQQQANAISADSERQRQAFNEYAAASGLNSGAGGQASIAMANQLQGDMSALRRSQAENEAELNNQLTMLKVDYQNAVATAIAQGEYERAAALMEEYKLAQQSAIETARAQADENYRAHSSKTAWEQEMYDRQVAAEQEAYEREMLLQQLNSDSAYKELLLRQQQAENLYNSQVSAEQEAYERELTAQQMAAEAKYREQVLRQQQAEALYNAQADAAKAQLAAEQAAAKEQQAATEKARKDALERAEILAQYGDFSGYAALGYTPQEIENMTAMWNYKNLEEPLANSAEENSGGLNIDAGKFFGNLSGLVSGLFGGTGSNSTSAPAVGNDTASALDMIYSSVAGSSNPEYMMQIIATEAGIPAADVANWLASRR